MKILLCFVLVYIIRNAQGQTSRVATAITLASRVAALERKLREKCVEIDKNTKQIAAIVKGCDCAPQPLLELPINCKGDLRKCGLILERGGKGKARFDPQGAFVELTVPVKSKPIDFARVKTRRINFVGLICVQAFAQVSSPTGSLGVTIAAASFVQLKLNNTQRFIGNKAVVQGINSSVSCTIPPSVPARRKRQKARKAKVRRIRFNQFVITRCAA